MLLRESFPPPALLKEFTAPQVERNLPRGALGGEIVAASPAGVTIEWYDGSVTQHSSAREYLKPATQRFLRGFLGQEGAPLRFEIRVGPEFQASIPQVARRCKLLCDESRADELISPAEPYTDEEWATAQRLWSTPLDLAPAAAVPVSRVREQRWVAPIQRLNVSHHIPDLASLRVINNDFQGLLVSVQPITHKGLGLVAQAPIHKGARVAYYLGRLLADARWASRFCVASAAGEVMDIFAGSFPAPGDDGIPYVGPYANEPTGVDGKPNCHIFPHPLGLSAGRQRCFVLVTTRRVVLGEELVWDYGEHYGARDYVSKYNV